MKTFILLSLVISAVLHGRSNFNAGQRLAGYTQNGDTVTFIFDATFYKRSPRRVAVTGAFRHWNDDMNAEAGKMRRLIGTHIWIKSIPNPANSRIKPHTPFKFRIDDGEWLEPPATSPNKKDGNLIYGYDIKQQRYKAEIVRPDFIRLYDPDGRPPAYDYNPAHYTLKNSRGDSIPLQKILYTAPGHLQLVPARPLDIRRLYFISIAGVAGKLPVKYDGWFRTLYSDKPLGANYNDDDSHTMIRLFAPRADSVVVYLYKTVGDLPAKTVPMNAAADGLWEARLVGDWEGWYYDFAAFGPDEPGNHFYDQIKQHFTDPWARVSVDTWGPARIWPKMKPAAPLKNGPVKMQDLIAYEVHIQDFTHNLPLPDSLKGTFRGFVQSGLRNAAGAPVGFDHLLELGINAVHLMPVQEYLHYPDKEWQAAFKDDPYMREQGINLKNYQWGYRTSHAFALESRYRVKGSAWGSQNRDFRNLVQAFHDHGIAVLVDVVFNHTAERMDGRQMYFNFSAIDVPYFYRTDDRFDYIGAYGTETKSEERPMMQRWIIEQVTDLKNQYGIDGIRIDLAGQTDEQTLRALRMAVGPDFIIYGEPWMASADPDFENNPDWDWYKEDAPITFFQDESRNAFKGPTSNPQNKQTDRGYAGGDGHRETVKKALAAGFASDKTAISGINYLDIHDNWALADRFAKKDWNGLRGVDEIPYKIAATLLFTSVGPIVLHGGSEFMRSKGIAPLVELTKHTAGGSIWIHGKRDTYNLARANRFIWKNLGHNANPDSGFFGNYQNMNDFWRGLIALRKSPAGRVFRIASKPPEGYYRWLEPSDTHLLGYFVDNRILVLLNTGNKPGIFKDIVFPEGEWQLIGDNQGIDCINGLTGLPDSQLDGGQTISLTVPAPGLKIWMRR